jgi:hypothetical protein
MQVQASSGMVLNITSGQAAVPTQNNTGSTLCTSDAVEQVTISAAPGSGTNRIDLVTVHPRGNDLDGGQNNDFIMDVIVGTAAATPVAPAVPAGQLALAQVYVTGGSASIITGNITDMRPGNLAIPVPTPPTHTKITWTKTATPAASAYIDAGTPPANPFFSSTIAGNTTAITLLQPCHIDYSISIQGLAGTTAHTLWLADNVSNTSIGGVSTAQAQGGGVFIAQQAINGSWPAGQVFRAQIRQGSSAVALSITGTITAYPVGASIT